MKKLSSFLFLSQLYVPEIGAAQVRLHSIAKELVAKGHKVTVVTALPNYPFGAVFANYRGKLFLKEYIDGVEIIRLPLITIKESGVRRLASYLSFMVISVPVTLVLSLVKAPDYTLVSSNPFFLGVVGIMCRALLGRKFIYMLADLWPDWGVEYGFISKGGLQYRMIKWLTRKIHSGADYVSIVVESMRRYLIEEGVPDSKILFLPNGVDLSIFDQYNGGDKLSIISSKKTVVYAGNHGSFHGLHYVIEAAAILRHRSDVDFILIGDGSEKKKLVKISKEMGLKNVIFVDSVQPAVLPGYLKYADVTLSVIQIPTRAAKVFSYMACSKAIVYAGIGEGAEIISEINAGIVVPPNNALEIARAIENLLESEEMRTALGRNGRRYVEDNLTWDQLVNEWMVNFEFQESQES